MCSALFFVSPSLLDATNAWIPPLQIAGRETFWPIAALLFPQCAVVVQPGVDGRPAAATDAHFPKGCVESVPPPVTRCELPLSGVIFGMDDSR